MKREQKKIRKEKKKDTSARYFLVYLISFVFLFVFLFFFSRVNDVDVVARINQKKQKNDIKQTEVLSSKEHIQKFARDFGILPNLVRFTSQKDLIEVHFPINRVAVDLYYANFQLTKYLLEQKWIQISGIELSPSNTQLLTYFSPSDSLTYRFRLFYDTRNNYPPVKPKIAIIVKGFGSLNLNDLQRWCDLDKQICYSILPINKVSTMNMNELIKHGYEVLLDIPMEQAGYPRVPSESYGIFSHFKDKEVKKKMNKYFSLIPHASGAITHDGSLVTTDRRIVPIILQKIKSKNLYFIDNKPIETSIAYMAAQEMMLTSFERTLSFNKNNYENFKDEGKLLKEITRLSNSKIIITLQKPDDDTFNFLITLVDVLKKNEYEIKTVSTL